MFAASRLRSSFLPMFVPLALAMPLLALSGPSSGGEAAPERRQLTLRIELERQAPLAGGVERGRSQLRQHLELRATLQSLDGPMAYNPLDPDDARRQMADARRTQQRVQTALASRPAAPAPAMDPAALQARAQQLMARCGTDRECLMREASALSAATVAAAAPGGADPDMQARLQAYGRAAAVCERVTPAAARAACQAQARRDAGGGDDTATPDDGLPEPYRLYIGQADCGLRVQAAVEERIDGEFDDVQGRVPFTQTLQGRLDAPAPQRCPLLQVVLDTRNGRVWTRAAQLAPELSGTWERQERGRKPQRQDSHSALAWHEAADALQQRLLQLDAGGQDTLRVPVAGGGSAVLRIRWQFTPT